MKKTTENFLRLKNYTSIKPILIFIKLLISIIFIIYVIKNINVSYLFDLLEKQKILWIILAILITIIQMLLGVYRWHSILVGLNYKINMLDVLRLCLIANFFSSWFIGSVAGDLSKVVLCSPGDRGRGVLFYSIALDRLFTILGYCAISLLCILNDPAIFFRDITYAIPVFIFIGALILVFLIKYFTLICRVFVNPITIKLSSLNKNLPLLRGDKNTMNNALIISIFCALMVSYTVFCLLKAQHVNVDFFVLMRFIPTVILISHLPISFGGWGVRETTMIVFLSSLGVEKTSAFLVSIEMGLISSLLSLPGGIFLFLL